MGTDSGQGFMIKYNKNLGAYDGLKGLKRFWGWGGGG